MIRVGRPAAAVMAIVAGVLGLLSGTALAVAGGPVHGWWSQATIAAGAAVIPPDVPADGLYVQNTPSGAAAVSAVAYPVGGVLVRSLSLHVVGQPVMSQPPGACVVRVPVKAEQGGAWADRPDMDCTQPSVGVLSTDGTTVRFDLAALVGEGVTGVGIVAGGPADRVAFAAPTADAFAVEPAPTASVANVAPPQAGSTLPSTGFTSAVPPLATGKTAVAVAGPLATPEPRPVVAGQQPTAAQPAPVALARPLQGPSGLRRTLGTAFGLALVIACVVYWGDGFGAVQVRRGRLLREMTELRDQSAAAA